MKTINSKYLLKTLWKLSVDENVSTYIVGGFIRDLQMNRPTTDIDIVVSERAMSLAKRYASLVKGHFVALDEENRIYRVVLKSSQQYTVDFSLMRGKTIEADLKLRDFTINAVAVKLDSAYPSFDRKTFIDPCGGLRDIKKKTIRKVSDRIFKDDPLRMLRAYRLAATLGCGIEKNTELMISAGSRLIKKVSPERIRDELFKILSNENSSKWINRMASRGLLEQAVPEVARMKKAKDHYFHKNGLWEHSIKTLESLEKIVYNLRSLFPTASTRLKKHLEEEVSGGINRIIPIKLAALFHDIGKPYTVTEKDDKVRFYGHEKKGSELAVAIMKNLKASNRETREVEKLIKYHMRPSNLSSAMKLSGKAVFRFFRDTGDTGIGIMLLSLADRHSYDCCKNAPENKLSSLKKQKDFTSKMIYSYLYLREKVCPPVLINGSDIMEHFSIGEGPIIGKLLNRVREAQADGAVKNKNEAIQLVRSLIK